MKRAFSAAAVLVLATIVAAAVRSVGLWKDLWLDEVWSVQIAGGMRSAGQVFTLHHEINHYLNTLWLYWMGPAGTNFQYHLFSYLCGIAAVAMAVVICRRYSPAAGWIALLLFGFSYELVAYSTEARGYAAVALCALVAFDAFDRYTRTPRLSWAAVYVAACTLGILSQPIFVGFLGAAIVTTIYRAFRGAPDAQRRSRQALLIHAIPLLALATLWWIDMRLLEIGGGTKTQSLITTYSTALAWAVGTIQTESAQLISCVAAIALLILAIRRVPDDARIFFIGAIIVFPVLLVVARRSPVVYTRHFMIAVVFMLVLLSRVLAAWWYERRWLACSVIIAAYLTVNVWNIRQLTENGRGDYSAALLEMVNRTQDPYVTIGGDQDFRVGMEVRHYLPRVLAGRRGAYLDQGSWPDDGPQWIIVHRESFESAAPPLEHFIDDRRNNYEFVRSYPAAPLSGLHWFIYRNRRMHSN